MIKRPLKRNLNNIISAYKDNVAFMSGPKIEQFAPKEEQAQASSKLKM